MRGFPGARAALLTAVLAVLTAACGGQGRSAAPAPTPTRPVLKIATPSPLSGDRARREVGLANAAQIVADPDVLLVIGHLTSNVALPASEVYRRAGLAMISPANSDPQLTARGFDAVSRVIGRDDVQGAAAAEFAAAELKARRGVIVHDGSA